MKLNKSKLVNQTKGELNKLGYVELKDTVSGSNGLFGKLIDNSLFLTLGLVTSRYYDLKFTASFYLSKTTIWSAMWGDIPKDSYERISVFLTKDERKLLLPEEYTSEGVVDAWWNDDLKSISNFISIVKIAESRFVGQIDMLKRVENSIDVNKLMHLSRQVIMEMNVFKHEDNFDYKFIPTKNIDDIPLEWFKTAERILFSEKAILNVNTVKRLAVDAWRQVYIRGMSNG